MTKIKELKELLSSPREIVITSHLNPDGDAVGSSLALAEWLSIKGHKVHTMLPNEAPPSIRFVQDYDKINIYSLETEKCQNLIDNCDIIIAADYNDIKSRIGDMGAYILATEGKTRILIDHHLSPPEDMFNLMFSNHTLSSTAFLVSKIITDCGDWGCVTLNMANNIYLGMMTDTGNFSYGQLTSEVYTTIAKLVDKGVVTTEMNIQISQQQSENRLRLIGRALSRRMVVLPKLKAAYIYLTATDLEQLGYTEGDAEGVVNMPLAIKGIENSAIFIQKKEIIKISLRSEGSKGIDMNTFARTYFTGGGHRNAAGAKSYRSMRSTIDTFIKGLKIEIDNEG